jgi:hypothetical protein
MKSNSSLLQKEREVNKPPILRVWLKIGFGIAANVPLFGHLRPTPWKVGTIPLSPIQIFYAILPSAVVLTVCIWGEGICLGSNTRRLPLVLYHNQRGLVLLFLRREAGLLFKRTTQHCRRSPVRRSSGRKVTEMLSLLETLRGFATKEHPPSGFGDN